MTDPSGWQGAVSALTSEVSALSTQVGTLTTQLGAINTEISALQQQVANLIPLIPKVTDIAALCAPVVDTGGINQYGVMGTNQYVQLVSGGTALLTSADIGSGKVFKVRIAAKTHVNAGTVGGVQFVVVEGPPIFIHPNYIALVSVSPDYAGNVVPPDGAFCIEFTCCWDSETQIFNYVSNQTNTTPTSGSSSAASLADVQFSVLAAMRGNSNSLTLTEFSIVV